MADHAYLRRDVLWSAVGGYILGSGVCHGAADGLNAGVVGLVLIGVLGIAIALIPSHRSAPTALMLDGRYTLDTCGWPLIVNDGDRVVAQFPLPPGSTGDDAAGLRQVVAARTLAVYLNRADSEAVHG